MNYIVISPFYPQNFQNFSIELSRKGIRVLGIGQEPYDQLDQVLKEALTEYYRVNDLENLDEVIRAVGFFFHKYGPIDRVESHNEYWLELDAALRTQFNIFGVKSKELEKTKLKSAMKKLFKKAGVPVVEGLVVKNKNQVKKSVQKLGYPLIAKPDNGVGGSGTYKLQTDQDLQHFLEGWQEDAPYFFEQMIESQDVCTFDGLVDKDGNIVFSTSLTYLYTPLSVVAQGLDNTFYIEKELDPKLKEYGQAIVKTFGMKERFFHIEFFRMPDGDYVALEYNNRPAGGFTMEVYNQAHQINLYELYAAMVLGQEIKEQSPNFHYCLAASRRFSKNYTYSQEEIQEHFPQEYQYTYQVPQAFAGLQGDLINVLTSPDFEKIKEMAAYIGQLND